MIRNTREAANVLANLPLDKFLIVIDDDDREYVIDDDDREYVIESIVKRKLFFDDDKEWCYALKIHSTTGNGCIKR